MEGDPCFRGKKISASVFLPTPSAWRATEDGRKVVDCHRRFLPTPSAWRATLCRANGNHLSLYFYPRPPHGGRRWGSEISTARHDFYPRPPHGGRQWSQSSDKHSFKFLPTPSAWRATIGVSLYIVVIAISTHALRMEGDTGAKRRG